MNKPVFRNLHLHSLTHDLLKRVVIVPFILDNWEHEGSEKVKNFLWLNNSLNNEAELSSKL